MNFIFPVISCSDRALVLSFPEYCIQNLKTRFEDVHNFYRKRIHRMATEKIKNIYYTKATIHKCDKAIKFSPGWT